MNGQEMHDFMRELYPLCRSLTGEGTKETLRMIGEKVPLRITSVPSGTDVLGWTIPDEWNPREAYIVTPDGRKIADFSEHNLHLVGCSHAIDSAMSLDELRPHLHSLPEHPDWIPYVTSYYKDDWGFCLRHSELESLQPGEYRVHIDATLEPGHLHYGECIIPGETDKTVLLSTYVCHPSMCNDNLSGPVVLTALAEWLRKAPRHYTYRLLWVPETIGCLAWLSCNRPEVVAGLVVTCCGDSGWLHYKRSKRGDTSIDRIAALEFANIRQPLNVIDWYPTGSDERQYCSPGLDWPVGCLMRSIPGEFPEYHTSADNCEFVTAQGLHATLVLAKFIINGIEANCAYTSTHPVGEHHLGKHCPPDIETRRLIGWLLSMSDGTTTLLDIAERSGIPILDLAGAAETLVEQGLLK